MSHAVEFPLAIDPFASVQTKTVQAFVVAQVTEHWLHGGKATGDHLPADVAVDALAHARQDVLLFRFRQEERDLARRRFLRRAQTLLALQATQAIAQGPLELDRRLAFDQTVTAVAI